MRAQFAGLLGWKAPERSL